MDQITPKEVKILENPEDIQERREQVLSRYANFKAEARNKRDKLEDSRRFQVCFSIVYSFNVFPIHRLTKSIRPQYFKRDADELEGWIYEKLQAASDESYKDPTNLQAKIQKHQAFEAEVAAHSNAIVSLDNTGSEMIAQHHFASDVIRKRLGKSIYYIFFTRLSNTKLVNKVRRTFCRGPPSSMGVATRSIGRQGS